MSNSEILGLHRITKKNLKELCKKHNLYQTPDLNDQLYLHFQGFQSIENLEEYTGLKCLWLESNAISEIGGLDCQTKLKCLFLQNNLIKKIENLQCCPSLDTLNLSSNHITKIENCGIDILPELSTFNMSRNYLQNSDAIRELLNCKQLWSLDLSHNRIDDILVVKIFAKMPELRVLVLQGNPVVSKVPQYRKTLILECKNLTYLDSRPVFPKDRACAEAWKRGGYEEERKEHDRWIRMDRKNTRNSVNATLRLRQKHGAGDIQLLESSDDEDDKKDKNMIKQIPEDGTSSGDLEIVGVIKEVSKDLSDSVHSSSSNSSDDLFQEKHDRNQGNDIEINPSINKNDSSILSSSTSDFSSSSESSLTKKSSSDSENNSSELEKVVVSKREDQEFLLQKFTETEEIETSDLSRFSEEEHYKTSLNLVNDHNEKLSQQNETLSSSQKVRKQHSTEPEINPYFKTDLQACANKKKSLLALVSKEDEHIALFGKNEEICKSNVEDYSQENNAQSSSWWERTLAAARIEKSKVVSKANEDSVEIPTENDEILNSVDEREVSQQADKKFSEDPVLENQGDSSNFIEGILNTIIDIEVEVEVEVETPQIMKAAKENSQIYTKQYAEASSGSQNSENTFGDSPSSISFDSSLKDRTSVSTLREVITTFDEVVENISSRQNSQLLKELIANPLTKTLSGQTSEQINRQVEELKQQKLAQLSNYVDYVCAQREKYDDTLDVVNGRLMVVKRSTGALEELPPPPLSQRTGSTNYTSCGVSTTPTSYNDDDGDSDSEDYGTALSEDNDNYDEEENDIEQHASDTKIKSIPTSPSDVNYCSNESVSLSSAGSPTEIEKEEDNNYHHSDVVDDSQQSVARRLHNEIDSEVLPESSKWLEKKGASASVPADYKLLNKGGEAQTRSEFQVELEDSFQSFMGFGESAAALKDIALLFENLEADE